MALATKLKAAPIAPDTTIAIEHARAVSTEVIDALVLLSGGDFGSADAALKRVMVAAHEARKRSPLLCLRRSRAPRLRSTRLCVR